MTAPHCQRLLAACLAIATVAFGASFPNGPHVTSGRWIVDASGANVSLAGVNWPGHGEVMVPEGLQYQSIETIVGKIKSLNMNVVRLTFATEMIDQVVDNGGNDIPIQTAFVNALGQENGTAVYNKVVKSNPSFGPSTTRLQVFDAVTAECAKQGVYVHLDNHVSQAKWCCNPLDGNSWWGDTHFSTSNWTRGLSYMADHGKQWTSLVSMSLRNELRQPLNNLTLFSSSYNWETWYTNVKAGAAAIHDKNPALLVYLSGLESDTNLAPVVTNVVLPPGNSSTKFSVADFPGLANKLVLELHIYDFFNLDTCDTIHEQLSTQGFQALAPNATTPLPMILSEWGFEQNATAWQNNYAKCLETYLPEQKVGWMIWGLQGSYYVRENIQDSDESWGLLKKDWSDWRSMEHINGGFIPMIKASLAWANQTGGGSEGSSGGNSGGNGSQGKNGGVRLLADWSTFIFPLLCSLLFVVA